MDTNDILTLAAAFSSLAVSLFVAGWTVYRDAVQRPKFRVSVAVKSIIQQNRPKIGPDLYVEALNLGPLPNRIGIVVLRPSWIDRRIRKKNSAFTMADHAHPAHTARGQKVEVGDSVTFVFPLNSDFALSEEFAHIGVTDGYGRSHWSSKKELKVALHDAGKALSKQK